MYPRFFDAVFFNPSAIARGLWPRMQFRPHPPQLRPKVSAIELARIAEPPQQKRNLFRKPLPWEGLVFDAPTARSLPTAALKWTKF